MTTRIVAGLMLGAFILSACQPTPTAPEPIEGWVEIRGQRVAVEIAESGQKQALGLGNRDGLSWDHGMLFVYPRAGFYSFWMKRMRFSIDIVWILDDRIVDLDAAVPFVPGENGPTVRPDSLVDRVLEVPAGYAAAKGWRIGDRVIEERGSAELP